MIGLDTLAFFSYFFAIVIKFSESKLSESESGTMSDSSSITVVAKSEPRRTYDIPSCFDVILDFFIFFSFLFNISNYSAATVVLPTDV